MQLIAADFRMRVLVVDGLSHLQNLPGEWKVSSLDSIGYRIPFLYKPNQTLNYVIPWYLYYQSVVDLPFDEMRSTLTSAEKRLPYFCALRDEWLNGYGKRAAHDILSPSVRGMLDLRLRQHSSCSIGGTLVALRRYHDANSGQLPASLEELVPDYLSSVPVDYADGLPIKYSKEMKALWSAGENHFTLSKEDQAVKDEVTIVPVRFDGTYAPWKRIDPDQSKEGGAGFFGQ